MPIANGFLDKKDFSQEFFATKTNNTVEICSLRMGDSGKIISDISLLTGLTDGADNLVSVDVSYVEGVGSYIVSSTGLSLVKDASAKADGNSFVVVDDLASESHYGVRKVILSGHPNDVEIKNGFVKKGFLNKDHVGSKKKIFFIF